MSNQYRSSCPYRTLTVYPIDLLCDEETGILSGEDQPEWSYDFEYCADFDDSIAEFIEQARKFIPGIDCDFNLKFSMHLREKSMDPQGATFLRFSAVDGVPLRQLPGSFHLLPWIPGGQFRRPSTANGWPLQLLSVACLSLAAKMEEPLVPSILDLQIEGAKYIFEPRTIRRMELLVLSVLDWRLRSVTPSSDSLLIKSIQLELIRVFLSQGQPKLFYQIFKKLVYLSIGHHALQLQRYFVQQVIFLISHLSMLNMLNHGVMDSAKRRSQNVTDWSKE